MKAGCWATAGEIQDRLRKAAVYKITFSECTGRVREGCSTTEALTQGLPPLVILYSSQISHLEETKEKKHEKTKPSPRVQRL